MTEMPFDGIYERAEYLAGYFAGHGEIYPPARYCQTSNALAKFLVRRENELRSSLDLHISRMVLDMHEPQFTHEEYFFIRQRTFFAVEEVEKMMNCGKEKDDVCISVSALDPGYFLKWILTTAWSYASVYWLHQVACEIVEYKPLRFTNETWFMPDID